MGHERLAIVRPETGQQPLFNADKSLVLIANGEVCAASLAAACV
jgi:asparagine synthase (glutamine-hydrolysing)